jgi:homoserine kinase type II
LERPFPAGGLADHVGSVLASVSDNQVQDPGRAGRLVAAYLTQGALAEAEVERGLGVLLRFRWAVQADYFAWRLTEGDLTGIADASENEKGLNDAHHWLTRGLSNAVTPH